MRQRGLTLQPIFNLTTHDIHVSIDAFSPFPLGATLESIICKYNLHS